MSEEKLPSSAEEEQDHEGEEGYIDEEELEKRVLKKQQELREQLVLVRNGTLHSPGLELLIADMGKYYILEARADIEPFLTSQESEERHYALIALAADFHLEEYLEIAQSFLTSDPDDLCRIAGASAIACLKENTHDRPTLQFLAQVVHNEQEDSIIRRSAYRAMLAVLGAPKMERFTTATSRFHFPEDVKWDVVDEYWEK